MPKPPKWRTTLRAAQEEASLASKLYNDPSEPRFFEGFVVHIHLAWLYLLHARFIRDGIDYRYRRKDNPRRLERVDGEVKRWELAKCVKQRWPDEENPSLKNLEFFIALRNKIEHRHSRFDEALALTVAGKAQSMLLNFENEMSDTFGSEFSMSHILRFPLFVGSFTDEGNKALKHLKDRLPNDLNLFIADFHSGLSENIEQSDKFEMKLKVVLARANRDSDALALEFVRWDDMSDEERATVQELGKKGQVVIREQIRPVLNHDLMRLSDVVRIVVEKIPFNFTQHHAVSAWKKQKIRPPSNSPHPERTDEKYCVYDQLSNTYGYTEAWINRITKNCRTIEGFENFTGCNAHEKKIQSSHA